MQNVDCRPIYLCEQVGVPVPDLGISLAGGGVVDCVRGLVGATPECRDCVESLVCCVTDSCRWGGLAPSLWCPALVSSRQLLRVRLPQPAEVHRPAVLAHQGGAPLALL